MHYNEVDSENTDIPESVRQERRIRKANEERPLRPEEVSEAYETGNFNKLADRYEELGYASLAKQYRNKNKEESKKKSNKLLKFCILFIITFIIALFSIYMYSEYKVSIIEIAISSLLISFVLYMSFFSEHVHILIIIKHCLVFIGSILIIGCIFISVIACFVDIKIPVNKVQQESVQEVTQETEVETEAELSIWITTTRVKVRTEPNVNCTVLGVLDAGVQVDYKGDANADWIIINYNGQEAYVAKQYIEVVKGD